MKKSDLQFSSLLIGIGSDLAIDKENLEQFKKYFISRKY
ncbi:MAG: hypothetical protein Ct9H300mP24_6950 [Candidatus Neomarinimicrobiota bacterium]|nr:MAG: hypothetical protein Ct9H300mP24_6950 [Candidatus Neomarinimicrobiota bacterium]